MAEAEKSSTRWRTWVVGLALSMFAAYLGIQWQTAKDATQMNAETIEQLQKLHVSDMQRVEDEMDVMEIRLDNSDEVLDIAVRLATLEERTSWGR
jgi:hypothetical protein